MTTGGASAFFVDTNILVYSAAIGVPFHLESLAP